MDNQALHHTQDYATAKNLCYQWHLIHCITVNHDGCDVKEKYFSEGLHRNGNTSATVLTVSIQQLLLDYFSINVSDSLKH